MSTEDAVSAGLIDPEVADLARRSGEAARTGKAPSKGAGKMQSGSAAHGSPKKKRSRSRPASHPRESVGPSGDGRVELDQDGAVHAADLFLDLVPVPKERAQIVRNPKTNRVAGFTPARTRHFHEAVRGVVRSIMAGRSPIVGPVRLEMTFAIQIPKSWPGWKRAAAADGLIVPTGRPDLDNLEKVLLDAFNATLIVDDAFVVDRRARKAYADVPEIRVRVEQTGHLDIHPRRAAVKALREMTGEKNEQS